MKKICLRDNQGRFIQGSRMMGFTGKKHSLKTKLQMSSKRKGITPKNIRLAIHASAIKRTGRHLTKTHIKNALRRNKMSSLEKRIQKVIVKYKLPFKFVGNGKFLIEKKCPDFVNTNGKKIAVEVFSIKHKDQFRGGYLKWRSEREKVFAKYGWKTIFIPDYMTNKERDIVKILNDSII